ncbi:type III-A CRISPR-associated RAMP protein Csm5 [Candidatus Poribacteria bacterium]|nr:type III-A CRISPR-associated RAMP protein Csm5 [Candidatus Poribacteria bacterium]MYK94900.1 type III-A CRISPR-associated RAMP protein Csm5 [Candidatus Poribacteria bacterium]
MKQKYQLEPLTPVHIGTGETLNFMDGCYADSKWYHIDLDKVLKHPSTDINALTSEMAQRNFRWQRYLQQRNMNPAEFSAYSLPCQQSPEAGDILEAIKTPDNRPYIPGSTLKGALRTVLLSEFIIKDDNLFQNSLTHLQNLINQKTRGNPRRETPAKKIEQDAFGKDPNHDLLRALQVSDTETLASDTLEIGMAWTVTLNENEQLVQKIDNRQEYKNFVQQIQPEQKLTFTLKIDELLFREQEDRRLRFSDLQKNILRDVAKVCRSDADVRMKDERSFFDYYHFTEIANLYDELIELNERLSKDAFMLQIGWGTGYHANTVTAIFTDDDESPDTLLRDLRNRFRLGESRSQRGNYDKREFPKTRRILYQGQNPSAPLGWIKISPIED